MVTYGHNHRVRESENLGTLLEKEIIDNKKIRSYGNLRKITEL